MKNLKFKFVNGSWVNDDVDLIPTIKIIRTSKLNDYHTRKVVAFSIALCFLKWALMVSFGSVKVLDKK
jgi:hypothetical protein